MAIITIIGAGMMGSAMSVPARDNGHEVRLVGTHLDVDIINTLKATGEHPKMRRMLPAGISFHQIEEVDAALEGTEFVICGVSSFGVEWFGAEMLPKIPDGVPVLSITKGLQVEEDGTLITFPQVFASMLPQGRSLSLNAVGGPCTSYELADRHQTEVVFCGNDMEVLRRLRELLTTAYYHISTSTDVLGVEVAVALKNAFALGVTMAIGMAEKADGNGCVEHYNAEAALFGQSVKEMGKLLALLGGGPENLAYGIGDLYVTVFGGRTRLLGTLLGRGLSFTTAMGKLDGITLESVVIARRIMQALKARADAGKADLRDYPLLAHVAAVIEEGAQVDIPWEAFAGSGRQ